MICVLRIGGVAMDTALVKQALSLEPYRIDLRGTDGAKMNCLHYDIFDEVGGSTKDLILRINKFLSAHNAELASLTHEGIEFRKLDIGLMLYEDKVSISIKLDEAFIARLAAVRLSVSVSTYLASSSSEQTGSD